MSAALRLVEESMPDKPPRFPPPIPTVPRIVVPRQDEPAEPTEPTPRGLASGIDQVLAGQSETHHQLADLKDQVSVVEARVIVHGKDISEIKSDVANLQRGQAQLQVGQTEHHMRITELERPLSKRTPITVSIPPLKDVGRVVHGKEARDKELPSGSWIVDPVDADKWLEQHDNQVKAARMDKIMKALWTIAVTLASIAAITFFGLLARALLQQAHEQNDSHAHSHSHASPEE
jgi:hypothetical protein